MITMSMEEGFEGVASTVEASRGQATKQIVDSLELLTKKLSAELRKLPALTEAMDAQMEASNPANQATAPCPYTDRAGDIVVSDELVIEMQDRLNNASASYSESTSRYPRGSNPETQHAARMAKLFQEKPEIMGAQARMVQGTDQFGSLSEEELQDAAVTINLTTNPNPPARLERPNTMAGVNANVEADLYNLRMSLPMAVQNQILSYDAPILEGNEDSWIADTLESINPGLLEKLPEGTKISRNDVLSLMATHRVKDPQWAALLANKQFSGAMKDYALAKADSMMLDYEIWKQEKNTALLMAQLLAVKNRQERDANEN